MEPSGRPVPEGAAPTETVVARLATFPEDNPNLVIETDLDGNVSYLNPVARNRFPDLEGLGSRHPLLADLPEVVPRLLAGDLDFASREVVVGPATFEAKICFAEIGNQRFVRVYASDVTAMRNAERTVHELAGRLVRAQEEERRRISRELHDEAGQALTALKIGLSLIPTGGDMDPETVRQNIAEAIALVEDTHERIRSLARGLRPAALDAVGLSATLDDLCREVAQRTGLDVTLTVDELPPLGDDVEICVYRLVQEALTNSAIHAGATGVAVSLRTDDSTLRVSVVDDGRGTDDVTSEPGDGGGFGLLGMRERIELLSGTLHVQSSPGEGFRVEAMIPVQEAA